jgi:glycosyltransferase involved in cell wall biosynthesis
MIEWRRDRKVRGELCRRYFGVEDGRLRGAVFAPSQPDRIFQVGLLDEGGQVSVITRADRAHHGGDIPPGHGFEFPVPVTWVCGSSETPFFQFVVMETGTVFPKEPRTIPLTKLLKLAPATTGHAGPVQMPVHALLVEMQRKLPHGVTVAVTHELTRTGAPLILLEILRQMKSRHGARVVLINQKRGGPLYHDFRECSEAVIDGLEDMLDTAPEGTARLLALLRERSARPGALVNTLCSMKSAVALRAAGFDIVSLIHEYPHAFTAEHVKRQFAASTELVFPCADVERAFRRLGQLPRAASHPVAKVSVLPQGCYMLEKGPAATEDVEALKRRYLEEFRIGPEERVVLLCGMMDSRKGLDWLGALMRAHAEISPRKDRTHFIWAGRVGDSELFFHLKHELRECGVIGNFHHLDDLADTRAAYTLADVLVVSSRIDPFPSVVMEAWLHGVPVIGFDRCQGTSEIIRFTGYGRVVSYMHAHETARAIDDVLDDTALRARIRAEAPGYVRSRFSYRRYADAIERRLSDRAIQRPPPVILLGFHRSGTSFLARWLMAAGVDMIPSGSELHDRTGNTDGHCEDLAFLKLHTETMCREHTAFMGRWGGPLCIFQPDYSSEWPGAVENARALERTLEVETPWGWKDPRTLLFLNVWDEVFPAALKVLAVRHPLQVFDSLLRRGTDLLMFEEPEACLQAYAGYHRRALESWRRDPASWCVVTMPFDKDGETSLRQFLQSRITGLNPVEMFSAEFDSEKMRQADFTAEQVKEFAKYFPEAAAVYAAFSGNPVPSPPANPPSSEQQRAWLEKVFPALQMNKPAAVADTSAPAVTAPVLSATPHASPSGAFAARLQRAATRLLPGRPALLPREREPLFRDHLRRLRHGFAGKREIAWIVARLIVAIRRGMNVGHHWGALRHIMETPSLRDPLLAALDTRWMKSVCDTYADHGTPEEKSQALCLVLLVNLANMAETERLLDGMSETNGDEGSIMTPSAPVKQLWDGVAAYHVAAGDMPRLMFGRLEHVLASSPVLDAVRSVLLRRMSEHGGNIIARLEKLNPRFWR